MTINEQDGQSDEDRRTGGRRRAKLKARTVINNGFSTYDVTILDLSKTGAKLEFGRTTPIPSQFELRGDYLRKFARVVWRRDTSIGVAFD